MVEVEITNDSYLRWLRAGKPPMGAFLTQSEETQEVLAAIGDKFRAECLVDMAHVLGVAGVDSEEAMVRKLASDAAAHMLNAGREAPRGPTMAGFAQRRAAADGARQSEKDAGRRFLGDPPKRRAAE